MMPLSGVRNSWLMVRRSSPAGVLSTVRRSAIPQPGDNRIEGARYRLDESFHRLVGGGVGNGTLQLRCCALDLVGADGARHALEIMEDAHGGVGVPRCPRSAE